MEKKAKGVSIAQRLESDTPSWMTVGKSLGFSKPVSSPINRSNNTYLIQF